MTNYPSGNPRGKPRMASAIRVLHGDDKVHPNRVNRNEPRPQMGEIKPPEGMTKLALECWDELAPQLMECGILTRPDAKLFAEFCESTVLVRLARMQVGKLISGEYEPKPGAANPFNSWARAVGVLTNLGGRFGLTPSDRARLVVGPEFQDADDLIG